MKTQPDQPWTDAADAKLIELRGRGLGNSEIAREMGRGKASIAHRCAKLIAAGKLPRRRPDLPRQLPAEWAGCGVISALIKPAGWM